MSCLTWYITHVRAISRCYVPSSEGIFITASHNRRRADFCWCTISGLVSPLETAFYLFHSFRVNSLEPMAIWLVWLRWEKRRYARPKVVICAGLLMRVERLRTPRGVWCARSANQRSGDAVIFARSCCWWRLTRSRSQQPQPRPRPIRAWLAGAGLCPFLRDR